MTHNRDADSTAGSDGDAVHEASGNDAASPADSPENEREFVGVGPWEGEWPTDGRLDPELLAEGDRRNVSDRYRYWTVESIVEDLDARRFEFHIAVENWAHDLNIGTVVRNANAFGAAAVHIVGRRRWNRRGAMVTDRYQHVLHHPEVGDLVNWAAAEQVAVVGIDNLEGSVPIETVTLPKRCVLVFGQEGPGLSEAAREAAAMVCSITMFGSTRSINAGVASGIAMHQWVRTHALGIDGLPLAIDLPPPTASHRQLPPASN